MMGLSLWLSSKPFSSMWKTGDFEGRPRFVLANSYPEFRDKGPNEFVNVTHYRQEGESKIFPTYEEANEYGKATFKDYVVQSV